MCIRDSPLPVRQSPTLATLTKRSSHSLMPCAWQEQSPDTLMRAHAGLLRSNSIRYGIRSPTEPNLDQPPHSSTGFIQCAKRRAAGPPGLRHREARQSFPSTFVASGPPSTRCEQLSKFAQKPLQCCAHALKSLVTKAAPPDGSLGYAFTNHFPTAAPPLFT